MLNEKNKKHPIESLVIFLISVTIAMCSIKRLPSRLENYSEDYLYRNLCGYQEDIKIIAIDDQTLSVLGPYSDWSRGYFAELIEILNGDSEKKPQIIGMDIVFSSTDSSAEDEALVRAVSESDNVILASILESDNELLKDEKGKYYTKTYISNEYAPFDELASVSRYGFTNAITDSDGIIRKAYTQIPPEHKSFAYMIASSVADILKYDTREEIIYSVKPGETEVISMASVLDGTVPASYFADSIVLVGAYAGGMMDSYKVPCDYSRQMYGVEMQANYIEAFIHGRFCSELPTPVTFLIAFLLSAGFCLLILKNPVRRNISILAVSIPAYILIAFAIFRIFSVKLPLIASITGFIFCFICSLLYKYVTLLRKRQKDTQTMLMSMAESFAEAIEGRTPYNANHTKNVAKRCMEMLDYINKLHKEKRTDLHFSKSDKEQLYLAAMLHDIGKMDVPLEVMDKPTKLGSKEDRMRDRLTIIMLKLENDILNGRTDRESGEKELAKIKSFIENINAFNCGRPLKDSEWDMIAGMENSFYEDANGKKIPYLTQEESDDLHIKAGTLSDNERTIMQSHAVYTDKILSHMTFGESFKDVRSMASNHHELLNGNGYPQKLNADDLDTMTRILTIMDIYDSLIADDRPYKKPKSVKVAFEILDEEAVAGKIDGQLLQYAKELYLKE